MRQPNQYDLILHDRQWDIFRDTHRFRVAVNGRRFGKTALGINELVMASLTYRGDISKTSPQTVLGVLPTAVQARPLLFEPLVNLFTTTSLATVVEDINKTKMRIDIKGKPSIKIAGANDKGGDRIRGTRILFVLLDEMQDIHPSVFTEVVRPALSDTEGSRALFTGTPKGKRNILYKLSEMAKTDPEWSFHNYPTSSNPIIPKSEIVRAKELLPPRVFRQEYEADFVNFAGQIWTELDSSNMATDDVSRVYDLTVIGVDFGDRHPAMVVVSREARTDTWYIQDAWSPNTGELESQPVSREEFSQQLKEYVEMYDPAAIYCDPSRPSDILAIRSMGRHRAYQNTVAGFNGIQSGIAQVSNLIHQNRLQILPGRQHGHYVTGRLLYDYLASYCWVVDRNGEATEVPGDTSCSHICDALRYALAIKGKL